MLLSVWSFLAAGAGITRREERERNTLIWDIGAEASCTQRAVDINNVVVLLRDDRIICSMMSTHLLERRMLHLRQSSRLGHVLRDRENVYARVGACASAVIEASQ